MPGNRSVAGWFYLEILLGIILGFMIGLSSEVANPSDVDAINNLYVAFESPVIPGWVASGGDPCDGTWQGVTCDVTASSILSITLVMANLGGELELSGFSSLESITLSNNGIGGSIPSELPPTLINIFLSDNKFTGSIPSSLSTLSNLSAMSLNNNALTGELPDAFEGLTQLVNLDLSNNNLSGQLPPSMENLSSLTTLHLQNNHLSGTLDVLQDLPLMNLDIQNNLFNGPIPPKLLNIPTFRNDGNPFNTTIAPLPSPTTSTATSPTSSTAPFFPGPNSGTGRTPPPPPGRKPRRQDDGQSAPAAESNSSPSKKSLSTRRIIWISIAAVLSFVILLLAILLFMPRCLREKRERRRTPNRHEIAPYTGARENNRDSTGFNLPSQDVEKAPPIAVSRPKEEIQQTAVASIPKQRNGDELNKQMGGPPKRKVSVADSSRFDIDLLPPPPPPPPPPLPPTPPPALPDKVIVNPIMSTEAIAAKPLTSRLPVTSVKSFSIASLQQFTNSFSQENLIGGGMLGNVYRAELPDGRLLAIKKLDKRVANQQKDDQFIELVNNIDKIRHANVVELMGYCAEHGQRLLVYEYCASGTLHDALHSDDEFKKNLSWNARIRMALGAARALEYLHEICEPPIIHRNFKSANVLLDDELFVHVSDCGLAPLISTGAVSQLSGQLLMTYGYAAPEFDSGIYTSKSDVYSFGVVMLELLTGRISYDRTRSRGEQFLVRWAIPQLHDIDALSRMVDPALSGNYPVKSLSHFADIISRCVLAEPEFRPLMSEVVQDLMQMIRRESASRSDAD